MRGTVDCGCRRARSGTALMDMVIGWHATRPRREKAPCQQAALLELGLVRAAQVELAEHLPSALIPSPPLISSPLSILPSPPLGAAPLGAATLPSPLRATFSRSARSARYLLALSRAVRTQPSV